MVESSDEPSLFDRIVSACKTRATRSTEADDSRPTPPTGTSGSRNADSSSRPPTNNIPIAYHDGTAGTENTGSHVADDALSTPPPPAPTPYENDHREAYSAIEPEQKLNVAIRFFLVLKEILLSSWLNVLLIFVPVGIAVKAAGVSPTIVFAVNAIAIIPLAGLLSHATESVASEMGDTIGALMNVTFGNAVELIIFMYVHLQKFRQKRARGDLISTCNSLAFDVIYPCYSYIALIKNEIRIVQASLLGSILANLLLILGMCFLFGGLRFREQIYNSTVTQMSACLLSLSVMSLLLPTAFHASFTDNAAADKAVLQVSRGTSIILLLVYVLYLLFQLKSHAYMYQSTPQHVIDEESHPGVLADMLGSSTSSDTSSDSSEGDSDASSGSNTTARRIRRVLRGRKRRKSSASSKDMPSMPSTLRTPSNSTFGNALEQDQAKIDILSDKPLPTSLGIIASGDEADTDGEHDRYPKKARDTTINFRDFENEKGASGSKSPEVALKKRTKRRHRKTSVYNEKQPEVHEKNTTQKPVQKDPPMDRPSAPRVGFIRDIEIAPDNSPKRLFIRGIPAFGAMPTMPMPRMLSSSVFSAANPTGPNGVSSSPAVAPRRTKSLTDLDQSRLSSPAQLLPYVRPIAASHAALDAVDSSKAKKYLSRTSAILLLLVSTSLVAVCAEFLVASISSFVSNTGVSEAFVGLIILPIVGNAAEHVTAVTVASKNKMDLAIGVAVGSSIQIALFVTPVIVLLGWILAKDMSLYFSLFETISLFVSAFIVNFLVLDGRSNYLEGALLIAAYVIIALAAFFYPDSSQQSSIGGAASSAKSLRLL